jgi:hypothetical protein
MSKQYATETPVRRSDGEDLRRTGTNVESDALIIVTAAPDRRVRYCAPCAATWRGPCPCFFCGCQGVTGGEAISKHSLPGEMEHTEIRSEW